MRLRLYDMNRLLPDALSIMTFLFHNKESAPAFVLSLLFQHILNSFSENCHLAQLFEFSFWKNRTEEVQTTAIQRLLLKIVLCVYEVI